ncbi:MFS transporter [Marinilabilia salmonicolor]|jgi:maltose/moltooligosaccharide transporter|uniref:Maltose/moltooligosaccharide transporter n=1 Tax=Marinilabilia salmonicolor TaxID=989 RepID=A0A2T0XA72_9BACT|nr:MFS transporter [Marinilabilia salmonicolor]PRY95812.1 maltose/moltooligosaccharide transporter [Marinilabilia salmonicolor]RCW36587.1 maltose/moltooligosaccharide transporter [Marinilabilia salmonicolor]
MKKLPRLSKAQIWNMSIGFLGIQFGFALQNANASRILQTFGADIEHLGWFWLAAPITGMLIQPIVGHYSDKTWTKLGRRRPYFLFGAIFAALALIFMPNAEILASIIPPMFVGAGMLMIMDASINISMEPFRALVADKLPLDQRTMGFSVQSTLIGIGAVVGSWITYALAEWFNISKTAPAGSVPDNVIFSFYIGAAVLIVTIIWTVITTKEYSPKELEEYTGEDTEINPATEVIKKENGFVQIMKDFAAMPSTMKQLGVVQFFSWLALFGMWVYTTPAIAQHVYNLPVSDTSSEMYNDAGNWVGVLFGVYNGVAALYALLLPFIAKATSRKATHALSLLIGAAALISIYFVKDPDMLIIPMIGVGVAWASILSMPYAILSGALPAKKMGIYMGLFNFFITIPQIVNGLASGPLLKSLFNSQAIYALIIAGVSLLIAAGAVYFVEDKEN